MLLLANTFEHSHIVMRHMRIVNEHTHQKTVYFTENALANWQFY